VEKLDPSCIFTCIRDVVENGCVLERFSESDPKPSDPKPSRQEITRYMASWFRYAGVPQDDCTEWMKKFCADVLAAISSSSPSQIRHSTKSMIRYVYRDDIPFECELKENRFKMRCSESCPVFAEMALELEERKKDPDRHRRRIRPQGPGDGQEREVMYGKKEVYREQFTRAMQRAISCIEQGMPRKEVAALLNEEGFVTRTGRKWTYGILRNELAQREDGEDGN
jgi:hypothetical protein